MRNRSQALEIADIGSIDWAKAGGLVPVVVQDRATLQVLMLAYMNEEALRETISTGRVTFYSRSRQEIWRKGETSGATLIDAKVYADCDTDALLVIAAPQGKTCHLGTDSCFSETVAPGIGWLAQLEKIIGNRRDASANESYTKRLFDAGAQRIAKKVGEEGVEVALAGAGGSETELAEESADLLFHLLVLLSIREIDLHQVLDVLRQRHAGA